jgi:glycosyltransferase involved in cell wall biosynthesis
VSDLGSEVPAGHGRKVVIWKASWLPGSETFVRNQVDALERWHATCLGLKDVGSPLGRGTDRVLYGRTLPEKVRRGAFLWTGRGGRVRPALDAIRPDLVHAHFGSDATLIVHEAARAGARLVITAHGADVISPHAHSTLIRARIASTLRRADQVIVVSKFLASRVEQLGVEPRRIRVLYTGIPIGPRPEEGDDHRVWDLAFAGRLVERKGVSDALLAAASAQARLGRRLRMCVMGDGPLRAEMASMARQSGLGAEFLGHVDPDRVRLELSRSKIFLAPSRTGPKGDAEAFGMVFLEAAARATPVVAYRHGGVVEAVCEGVTGVLVDEGDVSGLSNAVLSLLRDPARRAELGAAGRARVETSFDIRARTRELERVYDSVVDG